MFSDTILWIFCGIFWLISGLPLLYECCKKNKKNKNGDYFLLTESYCPSSSSDDENPLYYDIDC